MQHYHRVLNLGPLSVCLFLNKWALGAYREAPGVYVMDFGPIQFTWFNRSTTR